MIESHNLSHYQPHTKKAEELPAQGIWTALVAADMHTLTTFYTVIGVLSYCLIYTSSFA